MDADYYCIAMWDSVQQYTAENRQGGRAPWNGKPVTWIETNLDLVNGDPRFASLSNSAFRDWFRLCLYAGKHLNRIPKDLSILRNSIPLSESFDWSDYQKPGLELVVSMDEYTGSKLWDRVAELVNQKQTNGKPMVNQMETKGRPRVTKVLPKVCPTVTVTVTDTLTDQSPLPPKGEPPEPADESGKLLDRLHRLIEAWNAVAAKHEIPSVRNKPDSIAKAKGEPRMKAALARLSEPAWGADAAKAIAMIPSCPFLIGQKTGSEWKATFAWFVRPESVGKIIEGNYTAKPSTNGHAHPPKADPYTEWRNARYPGQATTAEFEAEWMTETGGWEAVKAGNYGASV